MYRLNKFPNIPEMKQTLVTNFFKIFKPNTSLNCLKNALIQHKQFIDAKTKMELFPL